MTTVTCHCSDCGSDHRLGDRPFNGGCTTECPDCGSHQYHTSVADQDPRSERERIDAAIRDVDGVGDETRALLHEAFDFYLELQTADREQLTAVDNVGPATAERIENAVTDA